MAIMSTAAAIIVGFKNNASHDRMWEARLIYGSIIDNSSSFAVKLIENPTEKKNGISTRNPQENLKASTVCDGKRAFRDA